MEDKAKEIDLIIPDKIDKKYNYSLSRVQESNVLVGYESQLKSIGNSMRQYMTRNVMLVGPQGVGKTQTVEQYAYNMAHTKHPAVIVRLAIERLGSLDENLMVSRMESIGADLKYIEYETLVNNFDDVKTEDVTDKENREVAKILRDSPDALLAVYNTAYFSQPNVELSGLPEEKIERLLQNNKGQRQRADTFTLEDKTVDLLKLQPEQVDTLFKENPLAIRETHDTLIIDASQQTDDGQYTLNVKGLEEADIATLKKHNVGNVGTVTREVVFNDKYDLIIFIDEVHKLNNYGKKASGNLGSSGAMNALKEGLARGQARIISATTDYEYRENIAQDLAFDRRFNNVVLTEPDDKATVAILHSQIDNMRQKYDYVPEMPEEIYKEIVKYSSQLIREQPQPAKALNIMDTCFGEANELYMRTGEKVAIDHEFVRRAFKSQGYDIDLKIDARKVERNLRRRVKGQPLAIRTMVSNVRKSEYTLRNYNKPIMTLLDVGTTGTGKTESVKALGEAVYGREDSILTINGGDYLTPQAVTEATQLIGDSVQTNKSRIILIDEIEKADKNMAKACMRLIDEGIVRDSRGVERSLASCIIIATSNLGADSIATAAKAMKLDKIKTPDRITPQLENEWRKQSMSIQKGLLINNRDADTRGLPPEFLQRFTLVPFFPLQKSSYATIANIKLNKFIDEESKLGYDVRVPENWDRKKWEELNFKHYDNVNIVSVMIAEDIINSDAKVVGARAINNFMENTVKNKFSIAVEYREAENLDMNGYFTIRTNGNSIVENTNTKMVTVLITYTDVNGRVYLVDEYHYEDEDKTIPLYRDVTGLTPAEMWDLLTDKSTDSDEKVSESKFDEDFFADY